MWVHLSKEVQVASASPLNICGVLSCSYRVTKQQVDVCRWQAEQKLLLLKAGALSQHLRQCSVWQREQVLPPNILAWPAPRNDSFTTPTVQFHSEHRCCALCPVSCSHRCCLTVH